MSLFRAAVIDDESQAAKMVGRALTKLGFEVETFGLGHNFLARMAEAPFQLAFIDLKLPDMDGIEILEAVKTGFENVEGRDHHRSRVHRLGRGGHGQGRGQLYRQAVPPSGNPHRGPRGYGKARAARGEPAAQGGPGRRPAAQGFSRGQPGHARRLRHDPQGRAGQLHGPAPGRHRHGKGAGGQGHPRSLPAQEPDLRLLQLRRVHRGTYLQRAVRPRKGRLHRGHGHQDRAARIGQRRHGLSGRDRRDAPEHAGQAAPRHPGAAHPARGRHPAHRPGHPHHRGHQPRPAGGHGRRAVPRGPLLPAQRGPHLPAHSGRAARGHPAAGRALP